MISLLSGLALCVPTRGPSEAPSSSGRLGGSKPPRCIRCSARVDYSLRAKRKDIEVIVEDVLTYDENENKLYSARRPSRDASDNQDNESLAALIPGGRVSERPNQTGAQSVVSKIQASRPLKISMDLQMVRSVTPVFQIQPC